MIVPNPAFRPNPDRAIYLQGQIDQEMVTRLTPQIIKLKSESLDPLTIYIDSFGGDPLLMQVLLKLLLASNQDFTDRSRVITVVTSKAASAAADLLSSGDYALAYPGTSVLYHGVRLADLKRPLTHEWTSLLVDYLRERNKTYAMELAEKIVGRFMFRFVVSKGRFEQVRKDYSDPKMSDLDCFLALVWEKLSGPGRNVLESARTRYTRYDELLAWVIKRESKRKRKSKPTKAEDDAFKIKAIVDFEVRNSSGAKGWSFEGGGLNTLTDDFFLLKEYIANYQSGTFKSLCMRYGDFLLSETEKEELRHATAAERNVKKAEKVQPLLLPIWSFFVGFCHALQHGENELTATDAYWLGLIDEVIGEEDLPSFRVVAEYAPDPALPIEEEGAAAAEA